jgi:uncharacterized membrane protein
MNEITELEELVSEQEPEKKPNRAPLRNSEIAYHLAVILIDGITGYTVAMLTIWYYGVVWFLGNAVVFFIHHKNWERPENNDDQEQNAQIGLIVSVASMVIMAVAAGSVFLIQITSRWITVGFEVLSVLLFCFHALQLALYRFADDEFKINRQIAKAKAIANKKVQIAKAAGAVVEANKLALQEKNNQYKKHGDKGAVDAAFNRIDNKPRPTFASSVENHLQDVTVNPTPGQNQK